MRDESLIDEAGELVSIRDELRTIERLGNSVGLTMKNAFRDAISYGRSLNGLLSDIASQLADVALQAALAPVGDVISQSVSGIFSGLNTGGGVMPFAKGGVITAPHYFPMGSNGLGLIGEAGPEAIMPLRRGSDGRLGVAAQSGASTYVNFNVTAQDANSFKRSETQISAMLARAVARGQRGL